MPGLKKKKTTVKCVRVLCIQKKREREAQKEALSENQQFPIFDFKQKISASVSVARS